ncbi:LytR/AlgR family response regulator transcription factor [Flavobacterium sp. '19STA2R22 D10 B1']|uniref:LytR/AlgR family response regulator transcription factor n=1 Tax=Flavobacterium aerium TaxID=3037261 RepID=UPI00278C4C3D|nr:LytTR family DNA-binding domain-containing protein [Flavobacterium sp. '19STA2R22 D10 B1']
MNELNVIGVDDEYLALELIKKYCEKTDGLNLIATFQKPEEVLPFLEKNEVNLLISDINMPEVTGIELLQKLKKKPLCIFITAEEQHAAKAFELDVIDYLIKPVSYERFEKAITKAKEYARFIQNKKSDEAYIMFKSDYIINKVKLADILWIEGFGEYIKIICKFKKYMVLHRMSKFEEMYQHLGFIRIHKSYLVLKSHIASYNSRTVILKDEKELPIGRSYKDNLKSI